MFFLCFFFFGNPWFHRCAFLCSFWNLECLGRDSFLLLWHCKPNMMLHVLPFLKLYYWRTKAMKCNCGFRWTRVCADCREATLLSLSHMAFFWNWCSSCTHLLLCTSMIFVKETREDCTCNCCKSCILYSTTVLQLLSSMCRAVTDDWWC